MLADNCIALKKLHIFCCSQITEQFLYGHSNDNLEVVGGKFETIAPVSAKIVLSSEQ